MVSMFSFLSRSPALVSFSSSTVSHSILSGWVMVMGMLGILSVERVLGRLAGALAAGDSEACLTMPWVRGDEDMADILKAN
jgi:hypothetical protein